MARRLTTFSKFLITLLIVAAIAFAGRYILFETEFGRNLVNTSNEGEDYEKKMNTNMMIVSSKLEL